MLMRALRTGGKGTRLGRFNHPSASFNHTVHHIFEIYFHRDSSWTLCGSVRKACVQLRLTSSLGTLHR